MGRYSQGYRDGSICSDHHAVYGTDQPTDSFTSLTDHHAFTFHGTDTTSPSMLLPLPPLSWTTAAATAAATAAYSYEQPVRGGGGGGGGGDSHATFHHDFAASRPVVGRCRLTLSDSS